MQPTPVEVGLYIFILAGFLGYPVTRRVPPLLHTPLMSATNAISGISLIGSLVVVGEMHDPLSILLGFIAVACSSTNVVGGFLITDRMLAMFKSERQQKAGGFKLSPPVWIAGGIVLAVLVSLFIWFEEVSRIPAVEVLRYLYILSAVL